MKRLLASILLGAMVLTSTLSTFGANDAAKSPEEVTERIIENELSDLKKVYNRNAKYRVTRGMDKAVSFGADEAACFFRLPTENGDFTNSINITDEGLEFQTILSSEKAPLTYDFEVGNSDGVRFEVIEGGALVYNNDMVIAVVENMVAEDAVGNEITTELNFNDSKITLSLSKAEEIAYPVTAVMNVYSTGSAEDLLDWFNDAHWIWRSGELSLRLYPKSWKNNVVITTPMKEATWLAVYNYFHNEGYWSNDLGMKDQYLCHVDFARFESDWNLEPWRPYVGLAATIAAKCNP